MKFDSYSRFLKSGLYQECLERDTRGDCLQFSGDESLDPNLRIHSALSPPDNQNNNVSVRSSNSSIGLSDLGLNYKENISLHRNFSVIPVTKGSVLINKMAKFDTRVMHSMGETASFNARATSCDTQVALAKFSHNSVMQIESSDARSNNLNSCHSFTTPINSTDTMKCVRDNGLSTTINQVKNGDLSLDVEEERTEKIKCESLPTRVRKVSVFAPQTAPNINLPRQIGTSVTVVDGANIKTKIFQGESTMQHAITRNISKNSTSQSNEYTTENLATFTNSEEYGKYIDSVFGKLDLSENSKKSELDSTIRDSCEKLDISDEPSSKYDSLGLAIADDNLSKHLILSNKAHHLRMNFSSYSGDEYNSLDNFSELTEAHTLPRSNGMFKSFFQSIRRSKNRNKSITGSLQKLEPPSPSLNRQRQKISLPEIINKEKGSPLVVKKNEDKKLVKVEPDSDTLSNIKNKKLSQTSVSVNRSASSVGEGAKICPYLVAMKREKSFHGIKKKTYDVGVVPNFV